MLMEPRGDGRWLCLGRPARRMRGGDQLWLDTSRDNSLILKLLIRMREQAEELFNFQMSLLIGQKWKIYLIYVEKSHCLHI